MYVHRQRIGNTAFSAISFFYSRQYFLLRWHDYGNSIRYRRHLAIHRYGQLHGRSGHAQLYRNRCQWMYVSDKRHC